MKFNIGDYVVVKKLRVPNVYLSWCTEMDIYDGVITKVCGYTPAGNYYLNGCGQWAFAEEWLTEFIKEDDCDEDIYAEDIFSMIQ